MTLQRVTSGKAVHQLVAHLRSATRRRPVAVISTRNHETQPLIDVDLVQAEAGHLADVVVIPTGPLTYEMESLMVVGTHVFGGAGRVYPPGTGWEIDTRQSPLRLARDPQDAIRAADKLIEDAVAAAYRLTAQPDSRALALVQSGIIPVTTLDPHETDRDALQTALVAVAGLRKQLRDLRAKSAEQINTARKKSPKGRIATDNPVVYEPSLFTCPEDAVRLAVHLTWVHRIPAGDKSTLPIPKYDISPTFVESLEKLDDGQTTKAFKCVVDILTDLSRQIPARRVHPLRSTVGPDTPITRGGGATCYRASIETQSAGARRLHYWKLPSGRIELSRIVTHDDMQP